MATVPGIIILTNNNPELIRPYCTDKTLTFYWTTPVSDGGSAVTSYTLLQLPNIEYTYDASTFSVTLTGLTNGVDYSFQIRANNAIGSGPYSSFRVVQPGLKPDQVTSILVMNTGDGTLVEWSPPFDNGEATIKWYVIKVFDTGGNLVYINSQHGYGRQRFAPGVNPTYCNFTVQAVNDPGYSSPLYLLSTTYFNLVAAGYSGSGPWYSSSVNSIYASFAQGIIAKNARGNGIVFDGSTYWTVPNVGRGGTYILWYKGTGSTNGGIYEQEHLQGYDFNISFTGTPNGVYSSSYQYPGNTCNTGASGIPGTWNQYILTYGYFSYMYFNGVLASSAGACGAGESGMQYYIGLTGTGTSYLVGEVGQIRIEGTIYNQSQITAEYNANVGNYKSVLVVTMGQLRLGTTTLTASWTLVKPYAVYVQFYSTNDGIAPYTGGTPYGPRHTVAAGTTTYTYTPSSPPVFGTYYYVGVVTVSIPGDVEIRSPIALSIQAPIVSLVASSYNGSGTWYDTSSFGHNATLEQGTIAKNGKGNGIVLNGSTTWTFSTLRSQLQYTMSVWFKATGTSGAGAAIVGETYTSGQVCMYIIENTNGAGTNFLPGLLYPSTNRWGIGYQFPLEVWHSMIVTWDGTTMTTYIDGISQGGTTLYQSPTSASTNNNSYRIGGAIQTGYNSFVIGELGEIVIYNYPLTAAQVTTHYATTAPTYILLTSASMVPIQTGDTTLSSSWTMIASHDVYVQYYSNIDGTVPASGGTTVGSPQLVPAGTTSNTFSPPGGISVGTYYYVGVTSTSPNSDELRSPYGVAPPQVLVNLVAATYSGSGTWYDTSGLGNDATLSGGSILVNGDENGIGLGYQLNGGEWTFPTLLSVSLWTLSIWYNQSNDPGFTDYPIVFEYQGGQGQFSIRNTGNGVTMRGALNGGYPGTSITFEKNVWTSMTITWDGTNLVTYINGEFVGSVAYPGIVSRSNYNSRYIIGSYDGSVRMAGYIGEVYILNYPLSTIDVLAHYNSTKATYGY